MLKDFFIARQGIKDLERLTDRQLDDIGLTPIDLDKMRSECSFFNALMPKLRNKFGIKTTAEYIHEYLSESVDRVDLERRERELVKRGYLS
jgi:hypothetical protein